MLSLKLQKVYFFRSVQLLHDLEIVCSEDNSVESLDPEPLVDNESVQVSDLSANAVEKSTENVSRYGRHRKHL